MSQLGSDSKSLQELNFAARRTEVITESKSESNSKGTLGSVDEAASQEIDSQHETSAVTVDTCRQSLTTDCELVESEKTSSNSIVKDSNVDEKSTVDGPPLCAVDKMCSSPSIDLPEREVHITSDNAVCQSEVSESAMEQHCSEGSAKSSLVIVSCQTGERSKQSSKTDKTSTVIVISSHHNKVVTPSCQPDLDCTSVDVTEREVGSSSEVVEVPQSVADLYMCCSDDDTLESTGELPNDKQNKNADPSQNDDTPAVKCAIMPKQQITANGMTFCVIVLYLSVPLV